MWGFSSANVRYQNNHDIISKLDEFLKTTLTGLLLLADYCSVPATMLNSFISQPKLPQEVQFFKKIWNLIFSYLFHLYVWPSGKFTWPIISALHWQSQFVVAVIQVTRSWLANVGLFLPKQRHYAFLICWLGTYFGDFSAWLCYV